MVKVELFDKSKSRPKSHFKQCKKCYRLNHIVRKCPKKHKQEKNLEARMDLRNRRRGQIERRIKERIIKMQNKKKKSPFIIGKLKATIGDTGTKGKGKMPKYITLMSTGKLNGGLTCAETQREERPESKKKGPKPGNQIFFVKFQIYFDLVLLIWGLILLLILFFIILKNNNMSQQNEERGKKKYIS
ncbi:hypothetical protein RFI_34298 [Reticulomyxa filosa]|uniref:Uncharacterized protein n=1 Tax=Reticulomyxa filosa TaxID=46433 RepID=X6LPN8_RETFI|nr:hypothetical protein RFI_34298 [Reticulomyxa filosa]|eukprot:ETO03112.1 hypothetical protein RFI_34298 [Reticulomyxa filosa]